MFAIWYCILFYNVRIWGIISYSIYRIEWNHSILFHINLSCLLYRRRYDILVQWVTVAFFRTVVMKVFNIKQSYDDRFALRIMRKTWISRFIYFLEAYLIPSVLEAFFLHLYNNNENELQNMSLKWEKRMLSE